MENYVMTNLGLVRLLLLDVRYNEVFLLFTIFGFFDDLAVFFTVEYWKNAGINATNDEVLAGKSCFESA